MALGGKTKQNRQGRGRALARLAGDCVAQGQTSEQWKAASLHFRKMYGLTIIMGGVEDVICKF